MTIKFYILISVCLAIIPLHKHKPVQNTVHDIPWPKQILGNKIFETPLSKQDQIYLTDFPGKVARFQNDKHEYILRYVTRPSRKFHSSSLCLSSNAAEITYLPLWVDSQGRHWSQFNAKWKGKNLLIKEIIIAKNNKFFSDASSWYWQAMFKKSAGPWLAVTQITEIKHSEENE